MPCDEGLAQRLREKLSDRPDVIEKQMFGGLAFMVAGNMCCGVIDESLMVRVGPERYASALQQPHALEMVFTGRPLKGFVYVAPEGFESDEDLEDRVRLAQEFVATLPPK